MEAQRLSGSYNMTLAETYLLASKARSKLTREASRQDHDLRILVSHANMLDNLMDSLAQHRYKKQLEQQQQQQQQESSPLSMPTTEAEYVYADEESSDDESQYSEDEEEYEEYSEEEEDEENEEDEEDDDDYSVFQECHLPSTRIYSTTSKAKQYKVLPTVDEAPLEEYEEDEDEDEEDITVQASFSPSYPHNLQLQPATSSHTTLHMAPSIAVVEISVDDEEDEYDNEDDSSSITSSDEDTNEHEVDGTSSSESVPSLCYSSEEESEEDEFLSANNSSNEEEEEKGKKEPLQQQDSSKMVSKETLESLRTAVRMYSHQRLHDKRLVLPTPEQLDLLVR